jgi:hypothetical protein
MSDEWHRSPDFSDAAMRDFEKRLSKARRYNRPQYLRIKAVSLSDLGSFEADSTAVALLRRIIDEYPAMICVTIPSYE